MAELAWVAHHRPSARDSNHSEFSSGNPWPALHARRSGMRLADRNASICAWSQALVERMRGAVRDVTVRLLS